jgi:hypothetical protein
MQNTGAASDLFKQPLFTAGHISPLNPLKPNGN